MSTALIDGVFYNVCDEHQRIFLPGQECHHCAQRRRDTTSVLEARIADLESAQLRYARDLDRMHAILHDLQRLANDRADTELAACLAGV